VASVLINIVALATSFYSMQVYDRVIPTQGYSTLWALSLGVALSILFELMLKYVRSRVMEQSVLGMDATMSRDIFSRLLGVRLDQLPHSVGSLAGQLRAYESIRALLTASTLYVLVDIPFALFFIVIMGLVGSPYITLVALVFLVLSLISGLSLRRKTEALAKEGARAGNEKTGLLVEAVEGAETIKAGHGGWRFLSRWIDVNSQAVGYDLKIRHISEIGSYLTAAFQQLSYGGLVAVGAWQVMEGHMTMGALIACSILSGRAMAPVGMLPGLLVQYAHAKAALLGLEQIYGLEPDNSGVDKPLLPTQIMGNYRFEAVRYAYRAEGAGVALSIPNLQIQAGEKIGVLGPVGSGKSTLLRLLSGLYHPREGRVLLDDLELSHISRQRVSEQMGYLQQDHRLFVGTLRDNLLIGLPDPGDEVILDAARQTGLLALISEHSKGLSLPIAEGGKGLSGGQKQLVALTRLVLTQPRIWLLDEPTSSMDDELERRCIALLKTKLTDQHTAVIVTHKPSILPLVSRLIVIAKNRIILDGPRDEVLQKLSQAAQTSPKAT
jgi:ATP-binding cassette, subfamily C, bacterial LapB